ncbi:hypothetical protein KC644_03360 [Candidatus Berkelbacteria bacterium]|nr:hypothetical protein [Candidatus Berkelbacteria bacterium]
MALQSTNYRSIGVLIAIATVAVIFLVGVTLVRNNQRGETTGSIILEEPQSGLVVIVPSTTWTIGSASTNFFINRSKRIEEIQTQKGTCNNFSKSQSIAIQAALENGPNSAKEAWLQEFPGLTNIITPDSFGAGRTLVGIDTCNATFNRKVVTLRAQAYKNDVEIRFSKELIQKSDLSQSDLIEIANSIAGGSAGQNSSTFNELIGVMESAR